MKRRLSIFLGLLVLMLLGCAERPTVFQISPSPEDRRDGEWPVWPKGDQVPRFVYVGDLTGEQNFVGAEQGVSVEGIVSWFVGFGREVAEPVVLRRPQGVAEGADGRIWVCDVSRQAVFQFDTITGHIQVHEYADQHQRFKAPVGIAPMPDGGVLVSDAELRVIVSLAPDGEPRAKYGEGLFERPTGLAFDAARGRLFVADTHANVIKVLDQRGDLLDVIGAEGEAVGHLNAPTYLAVAGGRLYVTDTLNARIQVFDQDGTFLSTFGERGLYVGNLTRPKGVAVSDDGLVYVIESLYDHLLVFDLDGRLLLPIGGTGSRPGQFYLPSGVWAGSGGRVYVSDMFNGRVAILQFLGGAL